MTPHTSDEVWILAANRVMARALEVRRCMDVFAEHGIALTTRLVCELRLVASERGLALLDGLSGRACLCQEYVAESVDRDLRVQIVGGRVVGARERRAQSGDFRANIDRGASWKRRDPTAEQTAAATVATRALGLDFAGVDLLFGPYGTPVLCEVNANAHSIPEMRAACSVDVAEEIVRHIVITMEGAKP